MYVCRSFGIDTSSVMNRYYSTTNSETFKKLEISSSNDNSSSRPRNNYASDTLKKLRSTKTNGKSNKITNLKLEYDSTHPLASSISTRVHQVSPTTIENLLVVESHTVKMKSISTYMFNKDMKNSLKKSFPPDFSMSTIKNSRKNNIKTNTAFSSNIHQQERTYETGKTSIFDETKLVDIFKTNYVMPKPSTIVDTMNSTRKEMLIIGLDTEIKQGIATGFPSKEPKISVSDSEYLKTLLNEKISKEVKTDNTEFWAENAETKISRSINIKVTITSNDLEKHFYNSENSSHKEDTVYSEKFTKAESNKNTQIMSSNSIDINLITIAVKVTTKPSLVTLSLLQNTFDRTTKASAKLQKMTESIIQTERTNAINAIIDKLSSPKKDVSTMHDKKVEKTNTVIFITNKPASQVSHTETIIINRSRSFITFDSNNAYSDFTVSHKNKHSDEKTLKTNILSFNSKLSTVYTSTGSFDKFLSHKLSIVSDTISKMTAEKINKKSTINDIDIFSKMKSTQNEDASFTRLEEYNETVINNTVLRTNTKDIVDKQQSTLLNNTILNTQSLSINESTRTISEKKKNQTISTSRIKTITTSTITKILTKEKTYHYDDNIQLSSPNTGTKAYIITVSTGSNMEAKTIYEMPGNQLITTPTDLEGKKSVKEGKYTIKNGSTSKQFSKDIEISLQVNRTQSHTKYVVSESDHDIKNKKTMNKMETATTKHGISLKTKSHHTNTDGTSKERLVSTSDAINITNKDVTNDAETITYNDFTSRKIKESHKKKSYGIMEKV